LVVDQLAERRTPNAHAPLPWRAMPFWMSRPVASSPPIPTQDECVLNAPQKLVPDATV
jgi:hypothetical protein